ncbi:hypothetical protein GCM10027262_51590 [Nocardia tengchongensis]
MSRKTCSAPKCLSTFRIEIIGAGVLVESATSVMTSDPNHLAPEMLVFAGPARIEPGLDTPA